MVVTDFHIIRVIVFAPNEADTVLVVDPYAVLSLPVAFECLKPIAGWMPEIVHYFGGIQHFELSPCCSFYFAETLHRLTVEKTLTILVSEGLDHHRSVWRHEL